jgi:hypothetical protein
VISRSVFHSQKGRNTQRRAKAQSGKNKNSKMTNKNKKTN